MFRDLITTVISHRSVEFELGSTINQSMTTNKTTNQVVVPTTHDFCLKINFRAELLKLKSRTFKCERERNGHMLHYEQVFGNVFERRESKCCAVLMILLSV